MIPKRPVHRVLLPRENFYEANEKANAQLAAHEHAVAVRAVEALKRISNGDPSKISSPIGPLHAAGIADGWQMDKTLVDEAMRDIEASGWKP